MIEMRWKQVVTKYHSPIPYHAVDLRGGGLPYVLQYREMPQGTIPGLIETEWKDVEIGEKE